MCNCKEDINKRLSEQFGQEIYLQGYDMLSGKSATPFEHKEGRRNKTSYMFHACCPFCGNKYKERE